MFDADRPAFVPINAPPRSPVLALGQVLTNRLIVIWPFVNPHMTYGGTVEQLFS
jgi:hypothetical protein